MLDSTDQLPAFREFVLTCSLLLEAPQLGDVGAQVDDQSVELPITAHDVASSAGSGAGRGLRLRLGLDRDVAAGAARASAGTPRCVRPSSSSTAGSRSIRITIASRNTAVAMPSPNISSTRLPLIANAPNTATITAAAAVITRPVRARPSRTAALRVAASVPLLVDS